MSLAEELLREFPDRLGGLLLRPSDGGRFEVSVAGTLLYSKLETDQFPQPGGMAGLLAPRL